MSATDHSQSKRIRHRHTCTHCGINLSKSSFYEHSSICPRNAGDPSIGKNVAISDSDSPFDPLSDTEPVPVNTLDDATGFYDSPMDTAPWEADDSNADETTCNTENLSLTDDDVSV